ncbi:GNAT family N-acetyltransferase [Fenollaria massiliensis]|uniref:GNAT family N-acetyltransferase n=1 Tax=Fenollaria massiliensis TaxID=938288 RepID=A0A9E7ITW8_9FIRM|nr:GNAT family N-acetyltransferase [Fenollaria massiliensis]UQK58762.1 GNAT family N-acetyltransferase [Fenollaria massiliensis]
MIRRANKEDIKCIMPIYEAAKKKMRTDGNLHQWSDKYPDEETLLNDIARDELYIAYNDEEIYGVFMLSFSGEDTYKEIQGAWLNDEPYAVIHRIASFGKGKNLLKDAINFAFEKTNNIRIDTHEDNNIMHTLLKKLGFFYTGIIHLKDGDERMAYQLIKSE